MSTAALWIPLLFFSSCSLLAVSTSPPKLHCHTEVYWFCECKDLIYSRMKWASSCLSVLCSYEKLLQGRWSSNKNTSCILVASVPVSGTKHTQVCTLGTPMEARKHTYNHLTVTMLRLNHILPTLVSSHFIIVLPCGISSVFVLSHYISFSLLSFKRRIYRTIWDSLFFFSWWHW